MRSTSGIKTPSTISPAGHACAPRALETIEGAAARLRSNPERLGERCERAADQVGDVAVARLDAGVVAFKTQGSWKVRLRPALGEALSGGDQ